MNLLFFGDLHIREKDLDECQLVLNEISELIKRHAVGKLFITGDTFDRVNPSPKELDLFSHFLKTLTIPVIIIAAQSHESLSSTETILNHIEILTNTVIVVKEYHDEEYLYVGHFIVKESKNSFAGTVPKSDLQQYRYVVLGHAHSFETISPNILQLGSSRYVDFAEARDKAKVALLCENYREMTEKWHYLGLKTPYSMKDVYFDLSGQKPPAGSTSVKSKEEKNKDSINHV